MLEIDVIEDSNNFTAVVLYFVLLHVYKFDPIKEKCMLWTRNVHVQEWTLTFWLIVFEIHSCIDYKEKVLVIGLEKK